MTSLTFHSDQKRYYLPKTIGEPTFFTLLHSCAFPGFETHDTLKIGHIATFVIVRVPMIAMNTRTRFGALALTLTLALTLASTFARDPAQPIEPIQEVEHATHV